MQAMGDRTGGGWRPSPGAVYPTIAQLEDEGLVTTQEEGGRRLVTLTPEGRAYLEERSARLGDPFADFAGRASWPDLREGMQELQAAARQIVTSGSTAQINAAAEVLAQARRSLYLILAGEPEDAEDWPHLAYCPARSPAPHEVRERTTRPGRRRCNRP
jgi:DNA-binding PadR family transcriptional regulator